MTGDKIENLQEVLWEQLGDNKKITDVKTERLTAPGENYGSTMLKLDVTLVNEKDNSEEEIHAVAKLLPDNEFSREVFNVQVTCKNEIALYATVMPTLQEFQREHGVKEVIECYPKLYGARINLDGRSDLVDDNAVLILENLNASGYTTVDRYEGFDLATARLILKNLAAFHAVPLALKLKKPEVFDEKVRPYLAPLIPPPSPNEDEVIKVLQKMLEESSKCLPYVPKIEEAFRKLNDTSKVVREPFATLTHGDMWVNNTMVKFKNGKPVSNKLVDFQGCSYGSPAIDVFFFLFTSVQTSVLQEHLDALIKLYHSYFVSHLEQLGCDVGPFGYENFLEELKLETPSEITHSLIMTVFIILRKKGETFSEEEYKNPDFDKMRKDMREDAKERSRLMVQVCGDKGWL